MRVLMTTDTVGGVWTYALELADALAAHDTEVVLATIGPPPSPGQRAELARSAVVDVRSLDGLLEWMDDPWADLERSGEWLLELRDEVRPDLVHLNAYAHGTLPWGVPVVVVGHSCVLSWWRAVRRENAPAEWDAYREAVTAGLALADLVVAPTRTMLDELERLYAPPGLTAAIPNGRRPPAVRGRKEPLVLAAGRLWDEAKNVAALDRVAPRLRWPVVVAGEGPAPVNAHGLGHLRRDELDSWLSRASIFALPARYEPFGLAALEAAGAGAALVLGDIPSLREVWGDAALYVDPDDDDELAAALTRLADEPELRTGMAERAVARAGAYTPARMGAAYAAAYAALVPTEAAA
jgi:glycosyltransferase involved in cell wall biosynthesis